MHLAKTRVTVLKNFAQGIIDTPKGAFIGSLSVASISLLLSAIASEVVPVCRQDELDERFVLAESDAFVPAAWARACLPFQKTRTLPTVMEWRCPGLPALFTVTSGWHRSASPASAGRSRDGCRHDLTAASHPRQTGEPPYTPRTRLLTQQPKTAQPKSPVSCRALLIGGNMHTILSWGMGVESTAILLRWLLEPNTRPCALDELLVLTAQTGDEYDDTRVLCEDHILPLLREHHVRFVEVARRGHLEKEGIVVLSDSRAPARMHMAGAYKLSDELRAAGTVPQFGGEHRCSLKFKAFVIETWLRERFQVPAKHAFGYSLDEPKRVAKSEQAMADRVAFGFSSEEPGRAHRASSYDRPNRIGFYPLIEWGWTRQMCLDYLFSKLGVVWEKSACVYCPFNQLGPDALRRHKRHPVQVAQALHLELVSLTLNPRGMLYKKQSLHEYTDQNGDHEAIGLFREQLSAQPWRIYRVRRIYGAKKDAHGQQLLDRKGQALRAVEHHSEEVSMDRAKQLLEAEAGRIGAVLEVRRGIAYLYHRRAGAEYPTREEYLVAGPAVVEVKARYGLEWFEEQWEARQSSLFT